MKPMQYVIVVIFLLCSALPLRAAGLEDKVVEQHVEKRVEATDGGASYLADGFSLDPLPGWQR